MAMLPVEGLKIVGVVREETFGRPIGTWNMTEEFARQRTLLHDLADSTIDGEDPLAVWQEMKKRRMSTVDTMNVGSQEQPITVPVVEFPMKPKAGKDPDASFSALDDLFVGSGGNGGGGGGGTKKTTDGGADGVKTNNNMKGGSLSKSIHVSEAASLSAIQTLRDACTEQLIKLTSKQVSDKLELVKKRLTAEILPIYSEDIETGDALEVGGGEGEDDLDKLPLGARISTELRSSERLC